MVFQLDATAYPGNSGSALYDPDDGTVYGIINSVFVQGTRETAISQPSGITYAIPGRYIREMLQREKVPGSNSSGPRSSARCRHPQKRACSLVLEPDA